MIDWIGSKIGILIFALVGASALLFFVLMQSGFYTETIVHQTASDLARIVDGAKDGVRINYEVNLGSYTLVTEGHNLTLNGVTRHTVSEMTGTTIVDKSILRIEKEGDYVKVIDA